MAHISGIVPGFVPTGISTPAVKPKKAKKTVKRKSGDPRDAIAWPAPCNACGHDVHKTEVPRFLLAGAEDIFCKGCRNLFNLNSPFGIELDPFAALNTLARLRENDGNHIMILKSQTFGAPDGRSVSVELGDIFKPSRIGSIKPNGTWQSSKEFFSVEVMLGQYPVTLFPWEFGVVSWITIMEMRKAKEVIEQYVSVDDKNGYFAPLDRDAIKQMFWNR
jgi:hypothetical protein